MDDNNFKAQKLIVYNKHLPYSDQLHEESNRNLADIKFNLSRAVIFQELTPGILVWCNRLDTYLRLNGRNFSKEDHVSFIKLLYELMVIPDLEPQFVKGFATVLNKLLKKKELLDRDDLQLPWKPLYELVKSIRYSKLAPLGLMKFPNKFNDCIINIVKFARHYFPIEATEEMLLEWRPYMCPFDSVKVNAAYYFSRFLPTKLSGEEQVKGYKLWLPEFFDYWIHCTQNIPSVAEEYTRLFMRLAESNVGLIDWNPYMPQIFSLFLSSLNLPVNGSVRNGSLSLRNMVSHVNTSAKWFVYMIGGDSLVLDYLKKLFTTLESFYHPSNHGKFSVTLLAFLNSIIDQFVRRLHSERHAKENWFTKTPDHVKITDNEIFIFANMLKDVALLSVYSKSGSLQAAAVMQNLALLRPDLVLSSLLERTFEALETLVEPHQVTATLTCITSVARSLVTGGEHFPEAPTHVLPLLRLVLPGLDPNDFRKSMSSFTLISAIVGLVPMVDCMPALHAGLEMTDVEKELCEASGQFEDFILQFVDRCFVLIENSSATDISEQDNLMTDSMNVQEGMIGMGMESTLQTVFMQCSPQIFKSVLHGIFQFVSTRVLEVNFAGKMVSDMCRAASKSFPQITLKKFLPFLCTTITNLASVEGIEKEENIDAELLWYLEVISELVRCDGKELLPYKDSLNKVLKQTLHLKCKKAYSRAGKFLKAILSSCSEVYSLEWHSQQIGFEKDPAQHFYIRDWGKPGEIDDLNMSWHIPSLEELEFVNELVKEHLYPELDIIRSYIKGTATVTRDELHQRLQIVAVIVFGSASTLPTWEDKKVEGLAPPSLVTRERTYNVTSVGALTSFQCCATRKEIVLIIHDLFEFMSKENEDDAKAFRIISKIYDFLLLHHGVNWREFNVRWKSSMAVKKALADKLHEKKRHVRAILIERVQLQHEMRVLDRHSVPYTETDKMVIKDLVLMSTSDYTEVRIDSQKVLFACLEMFDYSARSILPLLLENIKPDPDISHEKLKGTLYILQYPRLLYLITHYWEAMVKAWPMIVKADQSEKPSIVKLVNLLVLRLESKYDTLGFKRQVTAKCQELSEMILQSKYPVPASSMEQKNESLLPTVDLLTQAEVNLKYMNNESERLYHVLVEDLANLLEDKNMQWRCAEICMKLLSLLLTNEINMPLKVVHIFVNFLVHDSLRMRKFAVKAVVAILHQQKLKQPKISVDFSKFGLDTSSSTILQLCAGDDREDNRWLQFQINAAPNSQEEMDKFTFVDKTHWGFQAWPLELKTYDVKRLQKMDRSKEELNPTELVIYEAFSNSEFLKTFFKFFSLEVNKGQDTFRQIQFLLYKALFRNYGSALLLEEFKLVLVELLSDAVESKHRCASEVIAGVIRGAKNWNYKSLDSLWSFLCPLLKDIFSTKIIPEMLRDWTIALITSTESRDPNRFHQLFTVLMDNPICGAGGSLGDTSRLMMLQNTIAQQEWRVADLYHQLFEYLKPQFSHPYKNVRDRIGSVLSYVFMCDIKYGCQAPTLSPRIGTFVDFVIEDLTVLSTDVLEAAVNSPRASSELQNGSQAAEVKEVQNGDEMETDSEDENKRRDRVAKTVLSFLINNSFTMQPINKDIYRLIPVLIPLEAREDDPDISENCKKAFRLLASKPVPKDMVSIAVSSIIKVCDYKSWNARRTALNFLQVMIFHNFFVLDTDEIRKEVEGVITRRLLDDQLEVREVASTLLSGLIHFGYIKVKDGLLKSFSKMAKKKIKKARHGIELTAEDLQKNTAALHVKHGGLLGLSACVLAFPYDVPLWMPEVLLDVGNYLHDAPQIQATVKKTLSEFRRTHHDNWQMHRQKFTDDQLSVLTDLLISPSYYA